MEIDSTVTIRDSLVARNSVVAEAEGAALAHGGGIANAGQLTVERTRVVDNRVEASGAGGPLPFGVPSGALGGGIWNGDFGGPPPTLALTQTASSPATASRRLVGSSQRRRALHPLPRLAEPDDDRRQPPRSMLRLLTANA